MLSLFEDDLPEASGGPPGATPGAPPGGHPGGVSSGRGRSRLAGRPAKIIVRVDLDVLLRGYPIAGELCDSPGYGPIPVSLIRDLLDSGQARLAAVLTKGREVRSVYLERRHPNQYQKTALDLLYPACAVKGCNTRAGLDADHREDWARTHYTVIDLLDYLCWHHHQLKTRKGWALIDGHGKRPFVPPTDPRHPHHHTNTNTNTNTSANAGGGPPPPATQPQPVP